MTPPPTARIPINKIQLGDTQTRVAIDLGTVNRYAELMADGVNLPPVDIYVDEHGVHWLADGYHRIEAAESCGKTEIEATIHKGSRDDALWAALAANRTHGLPMSRDDKRNAVEMALRAFSGKSNREIGRQVGCSHNTVAELRREMESTGQIDQLDKTVGGDGKSRPVRKAKSAHLPVKSIDSDRAERYVRTFDEMSTEELRRNFQRWRDQMEGYVTLEDHRGKPAAAIAERCGMPLDEINLILNPRPPVFLNLTAPQDPSGGIAIQQHNEAVSKQLLMHHDMRFGRAAFYADREGDAKSAHELRAIAAHYRRQHANAGNPEMSVLAANKDLWIRGMMLVIEAFRAAVGLDREPKHDEPHDYLCAVADALDYGADEVAGEIYDEETAR